MNCLCCGKPLTDELERESGWHRACIRSFFGTDQLPALEIQPGRLNKLGKRAVARGVSIAGVQKKLSLQLSKKTSLPRLTVVDYPSGYILKPEVEEYAELPQAEHFSMQLAQKTGIRTAPHALICREGHYTFVTKRVDRVEMRAGVEKLAMEDFCQLEGRLTEDKYRSSYERCAKVILRWSEQPRLDLAEFYLRLVFCFLTGNSDMHLKNFSLLEEEPGSGRYRLGPAYDLLPVNVLLPADTEECALTLGGKKRGIRRRLFLKFGDEIGLGTKTAARLLDRMLEQSEGFEEACRESCMSADLQERFLALLEKRQKALRKG